MYKTHSTSLSFISLVQLLKKLLLKYKNRIKFYLRADVILFSEQSQ